MKVRWCGASVALLVASASAGSAFAQEARIPINITSTPAGALVFLDDDEASVGRTPIRRLAVTRGELGESLELPRVADQHTVK